MADFTGFNYDDFVFFVDKGQFDDANEQRVSIKDKFKLFMNTIKDRIRKVISNKIIMDISTKEFKSYAYLSNKKDRKKCPHLSFYLNRDGLEIDITIPQNSRRIINNMKSAGNYSGLIKMRNNQKYVYAINVFDKIQKLNRLAGTRAWGELDWIKVLNIKTKHSDNDFYTFEIDSDYKLGLRKMKPKGRRDRPYLDDIAFGNIFNIINTVKSPAISIKKTFPPFYVAREKEKIIDVAINVVKDLSPLLIYLNKMAKE